MKYTNFRQWETAVNEYMLVKHGVGIDDIPDMDWNSWYIQKWTPRKAVDEAIKQVNTGLLM